MALYLRSGLTIYICTVCAYCYVLAYLLGGYHHEVAQREESGAVQGCHQHFECIFVVVYAKGYFPGKHLVGGKIVARIDESHIAKGMVGLVGHRILKKGLVLMRVQSNLIWMNDY